MSNAFASYAATAIPAPVQRKQERAEKPLSALELKMREKQRLSRAYRSWKRRVTRETLASEPRLSGFLRYLRTMTVETGAELIEAVEASEWLRAASVDVRLFALRMISARCDHINRRLGNDALDDPIPPDTSVYFEARHLLHAGGRA